MRWEIHGYEYDTQWEKVNKKKKVNSLKQIVYSVSYQRLRCELWSLSFDYDTTS